MIKKLSINEVRHIAFETAQQLMSFDEPIPDFETRFPGRLESCLASPFQTFDRKLLYKGLSQKAAVLFYLMIKNHPFENGNKRIAVTTLLCFLMYNRIWLKVSDQNEIYKLAVSVAESKAYLKDQWVEIINKFINKHMVKL